MSELYRNPRERSNQVSDIVNSILACVNTCFPATVKSLASPNVEVTPNITRFYTDTNQNQRTVTFPDVTVRVAQVNGIKVPVKVGDKGFVIVNQSDISAITDGSTPVPRRFDVLDGVFLPIQLNATFDDNIVLTLPAGTFETKALNTRIRNPANDSLIKVIKDVVDALAVDTNVAPATKTAALAAQPKLGAFNP